MLLLIYRQTAKELQHLHDLHGNNYIFYHIYPKWDRDFMKKKEPAVNITTRIPISKVKWMREHPKYNFTGLLIQAIDAEMIHEKNFGSMLSE